MRIYVIFFNNKKDINSCIFVLKIMHYSSIVCGIMCSLQISTFYAIYSPNYSFIICNYNNTIYICCRNILLNCQTLLRKVSSDYSSSYIMHSDQREMDLFTFVSPQFGSPYLACNLNHNLVKLICFRAL